MIKSLSKLGLLCIISASLSAMPAHLLAQSTDNPMAEKKESRKPAVTPFNGKLKAVDQTAKTLSVGNRVFQITSDTKILKDGQPATLSDGIVGEPVGGAYKKAADGTLSATLVTFGKKAEAKAESKKQKKQM